MFGILLLLAAAFSGHEVVANADASQPPAAAQSVVDAPGGAAASQPVRRDAPVIRIAENATGNQTTTDDDPAVTSAIDRVSDFYDTTPPTSATEAHPKPAATAMAKDPAPKREALGPHLIRSTETYESEGQSVVIEVLRPDDDDQRPAVLILHGASGIGDGAFYRGAAEIFAEHGYVTFIPHYLAALRGAPVKTSAAHRKRATAHGKRPPEGSIRAGFSRQEQVLRDAVDFMAHNPYVDSTRIGVFGLSLGGFHALTLSSTDGRIAAVVDMSGALRGNVVPASNHLAPTLELHGARDPIVPVVRARELAATLKKLGVPHELKIYPNQGHFLRGKAQEDALQRSAAFFGTYLTPSETAHTARASDSVE